METRIDRASVVQLADTFEPHPDVFARRLGQGGVLVHLGTNAAFELNETAIRIWELLDQQLDASSIVQHLVDEFDVDEAHAARELSGFVECCHQHDLLS